MVVSAAAPLVGVAGVVPIAFLLGNGTGVPATFLFMTLVMLAFSVGYVAMSRHVRNAGGFYAYAARGLGGHWGGATAMVALVAYNAMQYGLIGLLGGVCSGVFAGFGLELPWWVFSLIAVILVGVLGYRQVELSAKVLVLLVLLEYIVVLVVDIAILSKGGASGLSLNFFDGAAISSGSLAVAVLFCLGSFIGIEATTIYAEEARRPEVTIPRATYVAVLLIGTFYVFTSWLMIVGVGANELLPTLKGLQDPTTFFYELAGRYVGGPVPTLAGLLFITSLIASLSAVHSFIARYSYVTGREGLLPSFFGRTHSEHQSPHVGSVVQTISSLVVLAVFAGLGLDPVLNMFTWISQIGVLGVLGMLALTSLAVIVFFRRQERAPLFTSLLMPLLSGSVMAALFVYVFFHFGDLTGTQGGSLGIVLPSLIPVAAVMGWLIAGRLKVSNPKVFANMGANRT